MIDLNSSADLEQCLALSDQGPVFIFKHSTACPISAAAHGQLEAHLARAAADAPPIHRVKVIESRPLSNEITSRLGVAHQSPQLILVRERRAVWNTSHGDITAEALTAALAAHG